MAKPFTGKLKFISPIVFSLLISCILVSIVLSAKQKIFGLLFSRLVQSGPESSILENSQQDLFFYPTQIPLNRTTLLSRVKYKLSLLSQLSPPRSSPQLPPEHTITGLTHCYQTWNNCGPASLSMLLSGCKIRVSQAEIGSKLRPHPDDKHTSITELARYARGLGLFAAYGWGGSEFFIKKLVATEIPVMLKIGLDPPHDDWMCHYIIVIGYSDKKSEFILMDSLYGAYYTYSYEKLTQFWAHFLWTYLVIAPKEKQNLVSRMLDMNAFSKPASPGLEWRIYRAVTDSPESAFAWYNLSRMLLLSEQKDAALTALKAAYDSGLPWRLPWYDVTMYEIYLQNQNYQELRELTKQVLSRNPHSEEARYYRAQTLFHLDNRSAALIELDRALEVNPYFEPARILLKKIKEGE